MSLSTLNLEPIYTSVNQNVYYDFFNKVLKNSKLCTRIGGIFSSRTFASCAEGMQEFIQRNDGRMQLLLTASFSAEDANAIKEGINNPNEVISNNWIRDLNEIKDKFVSDHTKALAWMISKEYLEIKIMIPYRMDNTIILDDELKGMNDFKIRTGVYWDKQNNAVSFQGNIDFDSKLYGEYYHFNVFRNWNLSEKRWVDKHYQEFEQYWNNTEIKLNEEFKLKIISLPQAVKEKLIKIAPKSRDDISLRKVPSLRPYQQIAVQNWSNNNNRGIFEMATGTGKTFTAVGCIKELEKKIGQVLTIIVCPYINLMFQWSEQLSKWGYSSVVLSGDAKWYQSTRDMITLLESGKETNPHVIITSYNTFSDARFVNLFRNADFPILLLADEVHHAGSGKFRNGLLDNFNYRLGLTATLERYFDPNGTKILDDYFSGTVYKLDLEEAIKLGFLVGYNYYPFYVNLTKDEYNRYKKETKKIAMYYNSVDSNDREKLERALLIRAKIIRDAEQKLELFQDFIEENQNLKYALIYCSENQIFQVKQMLHRLKPRPIICREVTANNPKDPEERSKILRDLAEEYYQAIVAIGVLDEGADIPEARNCILLSSTGNPKQFIQRRGRVLRPFYGAYKDGKKKEFANIYDFLVIPPLSSDYTLEEENIESSIIASQLRRQELMAALAMNYSDCFAEIERMRHKINLKK